MQIKNNLISTEDFVPKIVSLTYNLYMKKSDRISTARYNNMTSRSMNIGVVGLGAHGKNRAKILQEMGHSVCGADADLEYCKRFEENLGTSTYTSPDDLYEQNLDAIIISTPNKFHETFAIDALKAGFNVLIEKPLAHNHTSAKTIASVAHRTGNICMTGYSNRFLNSFQVAHEYIKKGYLGEITHINARHVRRRGIPGRGTWFTSNDIAGGGVIMDIGASLISLLLPLSGWPEITTIESISRSEFGSRSDYSYLQMWGEDDEGKLYDVEDSVIAFCEFDNGVSASIEMAWAANTESKHEYEIQGTEAGGQIKMPNRYEDINQDESTNTGLKLFEVRSGPADHFVDSTLTIPSNDPYHDELEAFLDAAAENERPEVNNVEQSLQVQRAIEQIYEESTSLC